MSLEAPAAHARMAAHRKSSGGANFTMRRRDHRKEEVKVLVQELAAWLAQLLECDDFGENLFSAKQFRSGEMLVDLVNKLDPDNPLKKHPNTQVDTWFARDNVKRFIDAAGKMGVSEVHWVEVDDVISPNRNDRAVVYFLLKVARAAGKKYGCVLPDIVQMEEDIDEAKAHETELDESQFAGIEASLEHKDYDGVDGDDIDDAVKAYCNNNEVPVTAQPVRVKRGEYVFAAEPPPHAIHYVRLVRGVLLVRAGDDWEEFAALMERKMKLAYANNPVPMVVEEEEEEEDEEQDTKEEEEEEEELDAEALENQKVINENALVKEARDADLNKIEQSQVAYIAGKNFEGHSVLVVIGSRIPPVSEFRMLQLKLYVTRLLAKIAHKDYVIVYCHTNAYFSSSYFGWLQKVRDEMPRPFKKNLASMIIVHPSLFIRACFGFMRPFLSTKFWRKLVYISSSQTTCLDDHIGPLRTKDIMPSFVILAGQTDSRDLGPVFGSTLEIALARSPPQSRIPRVIYECVSYLKSCALETDGLFRVPGSKTEITELRRLYETDEDIRLFTTHDYRQPNHHNVASLLKEFLRDLEEPLVPFKSYDAMVKLGGRLPAVQTEHRRLTASAAAAADGKEAVETEEQSTTDVNDEMAVVQELTRIMRDEVPQAHRLSLRYLIEFLVELDKHSDKNRMKASNLAMIMAPNIMRAKEQKPEDMLHEFHMIQRTMLCLIRNVGVIFDAEADGPVHDDSE